MHKKEVHFSKNGIVTSGRSLRRTDMAGNVYVCVADEMEALLRNAFNGTDSACSRFNMESVLAIGILSGP